MHGRQKVEQTLEEEQKKAKERTKKLVIYQNAMKNIFSKRSKCELDNELLQVSGHVLSSNPDIQTLWNVRREVLLLKKTELPENEFAELITKELDVTEICLKSNPKSYGAWHHRCWIMKQTEFVRVIDELKLCSKYLKYDDRNFHCWDYRRYLLDNSECMSLHEELDFTTEKIVSNFSNYSSWHLRSTILPKTSDNFLQKELELIKNAAFTDPSDQSVWFYHRWLIKSQLVLETPKVIFAHECGPKEGSRVLLTVFNTPVKNPSSLTILGSGILELSEVALQKENWTNPWNIARSKLWILDLSALKDGFVLNIPSPTNFPKYFDNETKPKTIEFDKLLRDELHWVSELNEIEPDNKWIIATLILLMRFIDFVEFKAEITDYLNKIIDLDFNRANYYLDLRSKYVMEWKLIELPAAKMEEVDLSNLGLTSAYYLERFCAVKTVNLSGNQLNESVSLSALIMCDRLILQK